MVRDLPDLRGASGLLSASRPARPPMARPRAGWKAPTNHHRIFLRDVRSVSAYAFSQTSLRERGGYAAAPESGHLGPRGSHCRSQAPRGWKPALRRRGRRQPTSRIPSRCALRKRLRFFADFAAKKGWLRRSKPCRAPYREPCRRLSSGPGGRSTRFSTRFRTSIRRTANCREICPKRLDHRQDCAWR